MSLLLYVPPFVSYFVNIYSRDQSLSSVAALSPAAPALPTAALDLVAPLPSDQGYSDFAPLATNILTPLQGAARNATPPTEAEQ